MSADLGEDLLVGGEAVGPVLRVDQPAVEGDVEHPAVPAGQGRLDAELALDGGLQTGGLGIVVSLHAVGDLDSHATRLLSVLGRMPS
jgi:hypothetical protein